MLRGAHTARMTVASSVSPLAVTENNLVMHLTSDSPPQVWSIQVTDGGRPGHIVYPDCAGVDFA